MIEAMAGRPGYLVAEPIYGPVVAVRIVEPHALGALLAALYLSEFLATPDDFSELYFYNHHDMFIVSW